MTKAAGEAGVLQWVCNMAGCTQREMADARGPDQTLYWQIYAMSNLEITKEEIKQAVKLGYKGFALTVDAVRGGKRERDLRANIAEDEELSDSIGDEEGEKPKSGISSLRPLVSISPSYLLALANLTTSQTPLG
jgi:L-lactate dehydrogenase (cytochrome)